MIGFVGYSFMNDRNALNPNTVDIGSINKIILTNGKYDNFKIDNKVLPYNAGKEDWGYNTVLLAKFQNSLDAGNINFSGLNVNKLRLKRRKIEELNNWWTIYEVPYANENKLVFEFFDAMNQAKQEYEYAIVPVSSNGTEGIYLTRQILSEFEGTFVCEKDESYRLIYDLEYGDMDLVTKVGKFEPLGSKYPVRIQNANTKYRKGKVEATLLTEQTVELGDIDPYIKEEISFRDKVMEFLTDGKAKILKDMQGNYWLVGIDDDVSFTFENSINQKFGKVKFSWFEVGDSQDKKDLYYEGLIDSMS